MSSQSMHTTAYVLSLIGGIIIMVGSIIAAFLSAFGTPYGTYYGMGPGMMMGFGYGSGWMLGFSLAALVFGIMVVIGAIILNARPAEHTTWGTVILIFSIVSFIGMGGYFIGAVLGIAGGAIALSYRSPSVKEE